MKGRPPPYPLPQLVRRRTLPTKMEEVVGGCPRAWSQRTVMWRVMFWGHTPSPAPPAFSCRLTQVVTVIVWQHCPHTPSVNGRKLSET